MYAHSIATDKYVRIYLFSFFCLFFFFLYTIHLQNTCNLNFYTYLRVGRRALVSMRLTRLSISHPGFREKSRTSSLLEGAGRSVR